MRPPETRPQEEGLTGGWEQGPSHPGRRGCRGSAQQGARPVGERRGGGQLPPAGQGAREGPGAPCSRGCCPACCRLRSAGSGRAGCPSRLHWDQVAASRMRPAEPVRLHLRLCGVHSPRAGSRTSSRVAGAAGRSGGARGPSLSQTRSRVRWALGPLRACSFPLLQFAVLDVRFGSFDFLRFSIFH